MGKLKMSLHHITLSQRYLMLEMMTSYICCRHLECVDADINGVNLTIGEMSCQTYGYVTRPCADVKDVFHGGTSGMLNNLLNQHFGVRSRNKHPRINIEFQSHKLSLAKDVLHRLA